MIKFIGFTIKNDEQFKILFYLYVFGYHDYLENYLKDYLMFSGYNHIRDLDLLLVYHQT